MLEYDLTSRNINPPASPSLSPTPLQSVVTISTQFFSDAMLGAPVNIDRVKGVRGDFVIALLRPFVPYFKHCVQGLLGTKLKDFQIILGTKLKDFQIILGTKLMDFQTILGTEIKDFQGLLGTAIKGFQGLLGTEFNFQRLLGNELKEFYKIQEFSRIFFPKTLA